MNNGNGNVDMIIDKEKCTVTILVKNTREDLLHDFGYFLGQAKEHSETGDTMFLHKRFLRAALLLLFAYGESVVNGWMASPIILKKAGPRSLPRKRMCLFEKMRALNSVSSNRVSKKRLTVAKELRNLIVHFEPGCDGETYDRLSSKLVEEAAKDLDLWMSATESALNVKRHLDSEELARSIDEMGTTVNSVSSDPTK